MNTGKVEILEDALKKESMTYGIFDDVVPDPSDVEVLFEKILFYTFLRIIFFKVLSCIFPEILHKIFKK